MLVCNITNVCFANLCFSVLCAFCNMHTAFLEQEITRSLSPSLRSPKQDPLLSPSAPQPRELLTIEEESERLAQELREVSVCLSVRPWVTQYDKVYTVSSFHLIEFFFFTLFQVSRNRDNIRAQLNQLCQYRGVLTQMHFLTAFQVLPTFHILFPACREFILQEIIEMLVFTHWVQMFECNRMTSIFDQAIV